MTPGATLIETRGLGVALGGTRILRDVNITLRAGEIGSAEGCQIDRRGLGARCQSHQQRGHGENRPRADTHTRKHGTKTP